MLPPNSPVHAIKNIRSHFATLMIHKIQTMKKLVLLLVLLLSSCQTASLPAATLPPPPPPSNTYYVAPNGNDNYPGTQVLPWKTIQNAANFGSGTIYISAGTYPEHVSITRPDITFEAVGLVSMQGFYITANNITIRGFDITSATTFGVRVYGDNCLIEDNYVHSTFDVGIRLEKESDSCVVKNNKIEHASQAGIEFRGTNHNIENNEIWDTIQYPPGAPSPSDGADADGIRFFGSGHVVRGNYIHDISFKPPQNIDPHIDCFQTWWDSGRQDSGHDIVFDGNTCILPNESSGGGTTKGFQLDDGYNLTFTNNVVHAKLISIIGSIKLQVHDITFLNNTFVNYPENLGSWGIQLASTNYVTTNIRIQNNIFAYQENGMGSIYVNNPATTLQAGNNCVFRAAGEPVRATDPGDVWNKDPLFVNYSINDFRLRANSPCIDKGADVGVTHDHDGNIRPQGAGYDIGAFEFVVSP
jgi:hypothetical protein